MSTTPLTDAINALTTYANTVTGQNDPDLSSAVATLASGYGGGGGGEPSLPTGYTRMLCLVSSGTQYIDTGLYTKANQDYYIQFRCGSGGQNIFGNNLGTGCGCFMQVNNQTSFFRFGSANYITYTTQYNSGALHLLRDYKCNIDGVWCLDGRPTEYVLTYPVTGSTVTEDSTIHNILFGRSTGADTRQLSPVKIYYFACKEGGTMVREMYPAMRDSDSELGMYDLANNVFYTNAGSGTFTAEAMA